MLDAAEIGRRFPIRIEPGTSGLFQEDGGIVYADLALEALLDSATDAGAEVREGMRVDAVEEEADGVKVAGVRARAVVLTVGAWAPKLFGVDARPTRETVSYFTQAEPVPSVLDLTSGRQAYSLIAPVGKLKAGLHQTGATIDPDDPGAPDQEIAERTAAWVSDRFPAAGEVLSLETCLYTIRENDEFLLERRGRVVVGSPCSGHGFKFAPVLGQRLAALALESL